MQCQTCGLNLDPKQVADLGRCPRCGTPVSPSAFGGPPQFPPPGDFNAPTQQQGFGTPGYPPPQPGFGGPPQPGYGAPPQFGQPQGFPPPQPGYPGAGYPGGPMMAPPKKSRTGLIVIVSVIVLVVIAGCVIGALALTSKKSPTANNPSGTSAPAASPTSSIPSGYQKFSNSQFSIGYPSGWDKQASGGGEQFVSQAGQLFQVLIQPGDQTEIPTLLSSLCSVFGKPIGSPTAVTIGGTQWQQQSCGDNGTPSASVEATVHQSQIFEIDYTSLAGTYAADKTQYFTPMEQSFAFLT